MILSEKIYANLRCGTTLSEENDELLKGKAMAEKNGDIHILSVKVHLVQMPHLYAGIFDAKKGLFVDVRLGCKTFGVLSRRQYNPFWTEPYFEKDFTRFPQNIQNILIETDNGYMAVLPVTNGDFNVTVTASDNKDTLRFQLSPCYDGAYDIEGVFALIAYSDNPYEAVKKAYRYAYEKGLIKTRLREEKTLDPIYKGLGWCTWNAFYREVCEKSIFKKLNEFRKKGISLKWMIIDDGWMQTSDKERVALMSFYENKEKFPNGLKACIDRIKSEYGVEKVGVWHALTGYWFGIEKGSELFYEQKDNLIETNMGVVIPDGEKAYNFFSKWYEYLKMQGVDFVKIDGQGNTLEFYSGEKDCIEKIRKVQEAADRAVEDYFGGNVINCMALNNLNVQNRPFTSLSRSSDDFLPKKPESFIFHIMQNTYNAVFQSDLFYCDYDMWQSYDVTAKISSLLRAVSGGPIYLSDGVGLTDNTYIKPLVDAEGRLIMCDDCAIPMREHLFDNPRGGILKLINKKKDGYVIAVFNLSNERRKVSVDTAFLKGDYVSYTYFQKKFYKDKLYSFEIDAFDAEIINLYKVENGSIYIGDMAKYISVGGQNKIEIKSI